MRIGGNLNKVDVKTLSNIAPATQDEIAEIRKTLDSQKPAFVPHEDYLALLAFGGTIQSAYVPAAENIEPVWMNPALERTLELQQDFGVIGDGVTGAILLAKDSREITNADAVRLVHTIEQMPNKRILISCGTYMLPSVARVLAFHFGRRHTDKIIGVTGSWLPASQAGQDVDFNVGGGIAAINAFNTATQKGIVFAHFHGRIFVGDDLETFNLHPPGINPKFVRQTVVTQ